MFSKTFVNTAARTCVDIDNGATDNIGLSCLNYKTFWCGKYDDLDFDSKTMCCACGGGKKGKYNNVIWNLSPRSTQNTIVIHISIQL